MRNREVEFNAEGRPCAAITDQSLLDGRIGVEERLAVDLVDTGVDVAAKIGENCAFQIFVFKMECAKSVNRLGVLHSLAKGVRVIEVSGGKEIEWRVFVGRALVGCGQRKDVLTHAHLAHGQRNAA